MSKGDPVFVDKDCLRVHLPFINSMLVKFKNTKNEAIWQRMFKIISSDTQKLTAEHVEKLEKTIMSVKNNQKLITQPIVVKQEVVDNKSNEQSATEVTGSPEIAPQSSITLDVETTAAASKFADVPVQVKQEIPSPKKHFTRSSQIVTESDGSESEEEQPVNLKSTRKVSRKRILSIASESEEESQAETTTGRQARNQKRKREASPQKATRSKSKEKERSKTPPVDDEDERKVNDLKNLIKNLSEDGSTKDSKFLLNQFETIVGKDCFSKLKALFVRTSTTVNQEQVDDSMNGSGSDDQPLMKRVKKNEPVKLRSKKKTEAAKLQEDIMRMYIRDGVLSANGLRNHKRVPYDENLTEKDFDSEETEVDDASVNCQKGSSAGERSEMDPASEDEFKELQVNDIQTCFVKLTRLDLTGVSKPVKINKDGSINSSSVDDQANGSLKLRLRKNGASYQTVPLPVPPTSNSKDEIKIKKSSKPQLAVAPKEAKLVNEPAAAANQPPRAVEEMPTKKSFPKKASETKDLQKSPKISDELPAATAKQLTTHSAPKKTNPKLTVKQLPKRPHQIKVSELRESSVSPPKKSHQVNTSNEAKDNLIIADDEEKVLQPPSTPSKGSINVNVTGLSIKEESLKLNKPSSESRVIASLEKTVCNLSYVMCRTGVILKCNSEKCTFERTNHQLFQYHIQTRHLLVKWSGSCTLCKKSVSDFGSLLDEYKHMYNKHILVDDGMKPKKAETNDDNGQPKKKRRKKKQSVMKDDSHAKDATSATSKTANPEEVVNGTTIQESSTTEQESSTTEQESSTTVQESPATIQESPTTVQESPSTSFSIIFPEVPTRIPTSLENASEVTNTTSISSVSAANSTQSINDPNKPLNTTIMVSIPNTIDALFKNPDKDFLPSSVETSTQSTLEKPPVQSVVQSGNNKLPIIKLRSLPGDKLSSVSKKYELNTLQDSSPVAINGHQKNFIDFVVRDGTTKANNKIVIRPVVIRPVVNKIITTATLSQYQQSQPSQFINTGNGVSPSPDTVNSQELKRPPIRILPKFKNVGTKVLRPWLDATDCKEPEFVNNMLTEDCLVDLFKCMGTSCNYHTNSIENFLSHLKTHKESEQETSVGRCPNCKFSTIDMNVLANHVDVEHRFDRFACHYCFYRSVVESFVVTHQSEYHKEETSIVLDCLVEKINFREAAKSIIETKSKFISPIVCVCCKSKFYSFKTFTEHFKMFHENLDVRHRCNKCLQETTMENLKDHLEICHNIQPFHCVYCRWGSKKITETLTHLMNAHPNKLPFFCERVDPKEGQNSSIDSLALKMIGDSRSSNSSCKRVIID